MIKNATYRNQSISVLVSTHHCGVTLACIDQPAAAEWLGKVYTSALDICDMWWLSEPQTIPYFSFEKIETQDVNSMLSQIEGMLDQSTLVNRQFTWRAELGQLISYRVNLPDMQSAETDYFRKTTLLRYFHRNTNLTRSMQLNDVLDESCAASAVILGHERTSMVRDPNATRLIPDFDDDVFAAFLDIVQRRRSSKDYQGIPMPFRTLSTLLETAAGVSMRVKDKQGNEFAFYNYPVGGGIKSTHIFFYANHVESMEPGFYYYNCYYNILEWIPPEHSLENLARGTAYSDAIMKSSVLFFIVGDFYAKSLKYLDRAYRIVLSESGHLSQNLHLTATGLHLKSCVLMGFDDALYAQAIGLNTDEQAVVSLLSVGM